MQTLRILPILPLLLFASCQAPSNSDPLTQSEPLTQYEDLVALFARVDSLGRPALVDGIPDYSREAMAAKFAGLAPLRSEYARFDTTGWGIDEKIDYRLVGAHMAGLEFNHRIMKRWSRDPVFYAVIGWWNPTMDESFSLPDPPIPDDRLERLRGELEVMPAILEQAKGNLTEMTPDMARLGIKRRSWEEEQFRAWLPSLSEHHPELVDPANRVAEAIVDFRQWLEEQLPDLDGPSGIGVENYDWLLENVYLLPYSWEECVAISQRELERSLALWKMEEHRNRNLPTLRVAATEAEFQARQRAAKEWIVQFVRENEILPQPDLLEVGEPGGYDRSEGRNFFNQVTDRDPLALGPHETVGHFPDAIRIREWSQRPIPRGYDLYYISGIRTEALATGMEENLMHLGLLDDRPRVRELVYLLRAFRAIRALADLKMHSNEFTLDEVMDYAISLTPHGWYEKDTYLIWDEMDLYMRQPGYGMGYLVGAVQLEGLMADRALELGEDFDLRSFMSEFLEAGMIPMDLIGDRMKDGSGE